MTLLHLIIPTILGYVAIFVGACILTAFAWLCTKLLWTEAGHPPAPAIPSNITSGYPYSNNKPYKPKGKRSKMAGIRRNRAILAIAKGKVDA